MNIDWFTFSAQIVNFLVLVALLRWFLYRPVVRAMDAREQKIASRLEDACRQQAEAEAQGQEYERKVREFDRQREEMLVEARQKSHDMHLELLKEAREEVDRKYDLWRESYHREQEDILADLRRQAGEMGVVAAQRTLSQLASVELEQRMYDALVARLRQLDGPQREEIRRHFANGETEVSIRSAFPIGEQQQERLQEAVREAFEINADVTFSQSSELICGLELDAGGFSFGWNVKDFLRDVDVSFAERLKAAH